jgi:pimeloyl-ACP methyl ester carboxylesterase
MFGLFLSAGAGYAICKKVRQTLKTWLFSPSMVSIHHSVHYPDVDMLPEGTLGRYGWRLKRNSKTRKVIMFLHGNSGCAMDFFEVLNNRFMDFDIICVEYPGFGWNYETGKPPTIERCARHARELYENIVYKEYDHIHILAYSIGTVIAPRALEYIPSDKIRSIVLLSPIDDINKVISYNTRIPASVARAVLGEEPTAEFWNKLILHGVSSIRFHVIVGNRDEIVPNDRSLSVLKIFPSHRSTLRIIPSGHNDLILDPITELS